MLNFPNFNGFYEKLYESICSKKDVYVFNYICEPEYDFWYDDEDEEHHSFYVNPIIDLTAIQKAVVLSTEFPDDVVEDLKTSVDYYLDEHDELIQRLFIFQSK